MKEIKAKREWIKSNKFKVGDNVLYTSKDPEGKRPDYTCPAKVIMELEDRLIAQSTRGNCIVKFHIAKWNQADFSLITDSL